MTTTALPPASVPDPATAPPLRWGIIGTGGIAGHFVRQVRPRTRQEIVAVGSRTADRAAAFAAEHEIGRSYGSYAELVADPGVDVVYVASPHSEHRAHALLAIEAGKHVLVEKAFTRSAAEAEEVFAAARERGVFVMEAMWTRFLPHITAVRDLVQGGRLGEVVSLVADHGQRLDGDPGGRLLNPDLAGGALLDLCVYPLSLAHFLLGAPDEVVAVGSLTETGVDGQESVVLRYGERTLAVCSATLWASTATTASVAGNEARIEVSGPFYAPGEFTVVHRDGRREEYRHPVDGGFEFEVAEVARCVSAGLQESAVMPWQATLDVMRVMDEVRRQLGVVFPGE
ncbi:Gfo/Idh/MocA family protein [Georgenia faecalis]|uniref:Gfo/Idh/MocA family protein n=1 Tax=Georgenia faecalis TaxID=2483799 RepID=A0ABV9D6U5_9MICO|nr:Gfo/Idh/MocA family oxidoreductase [Georgenia faecalis]